MPVLLTYKGMNFYLVLSRMSVEWFPALSPKNGLLGYFSFREEILNDLKAQKRDFRYCRTISQR